MPFDAVNRDRIGRARCSSDVQEGARNHGPKLYVSQPNSGAANLGESNRAICMPTNDRETSIFYLKLQWISARDEAERKSLGEKIRKLLEQSKSSKQS